MVNTFELELNDDTSVEYYGDKNDLLSIIKNQTSEFNGEFNSKSGKSKYKIATVCIANNNVDYHYCNKIKNVLLKFNDITDNKNLIITNENNDKILKVNLQNIILQKNLISLLNVLSNKSLEYEIELERKKSLRSNLTKTKEVKSKSRFKKRRVSNLNSTDHQIKKIYKDLLYDGIILEFNEDLSFWKITSNIFLIYKEYSFNKFSDETNTVLDELFSKRIKFNDFNYDPEFQGNHFHNHHATNFIQKRFNNHIIDYTKYKLRDIQISFDPNISLLNVKMLPFQIQSVQWMLDKELEHIIYNEDISIIELNKFLNSRVSYGYEYIEPLGTGEEPIFWNKFTNYIATYKEAKDIYESMTSGISQYGAKGLLSEEMGLGKTIEILSLILLNKRKILDNSIENNTFSSDDGRSILKTKCTLIICPNAILEQWINEVKSHTTGLSIFHYKGYQHVKKYFKTDIIGEIVEQLANYDIIITTYTVVANEVHYAEYNVNLRARKSVGLPKYDYSSPLSLMQFYRIILDEVQMLHSGSTKAAKCTSLLHRVHTWGVSGTPIQLIRDFQTILSYLQIHPFNKFPEIVNNINNTVINWSNDKSDLATDDISNVTNGYTFNLTELMNLFIDFNISIRHIKKNVKDQIKIPKQENYLVSLDFAPIEWDNYLDLWNAFLEASGYSADGSGTTRLTDMQLNQWLSKLRYLCCHALIPEHNKLKSKNSKFNLKLHNIDDILKLMTIEAVEKLDILYRDNYWLKLKSAQAKMELQNNPKGALLVLESVKTQLRNDLKDKFSINDPFDISLVSDILKYEEIKSDKLSDDNSESLEVVSRNSDVMRIRAYMDLLHQCYFFIATAYYFMGSHKLEQVDDENEKLKLIKNNEDGNKDDNMDIEQKKYTDVYSENEMKEIQSMQTLEQDNYSDAEKLRQQILLSRAQKVESTIEEMRTSFNKKNKIFPTSLKLIDFGSERDFSTSISTSKSFQKLNELINLVNKQASQFNDFFSELLKLSYQPITRDYDENNSDDNKDEKAQEYTNSIDDQDKVFSYLSCMEKILVNRDLLLNSDEEIKIPKKLAPSAQQLSDFNLGLLSKLDLVGGIPFKPIFDELKNTRIVVSLTNKPSISNSTNNKFEEHLLSYEGELKRMKRENKQLRESLKKINTIYNSKVEYYSHLQKISDSLVSLLQLERNNRAVILRSIRNDDKYSQNLKHINTAESRIKYLNSLNILRESARDNKSFNCTICLNQIYTGSIIKCGHFFCKKCIQSWLKNKNSCPLCKTETGLSEIYNFKFKEEDTEYSSYGSQPKSKEISDECYENDRITDDEMVKKEDELMNSRDSDSIFNEKFVTFSSLKEVQKILLKESYGAKIDSVVKLILYLRIKAESENDEPPQILLYSQSLDFLKVISEVLTIHDIKHLSSLSNVATVGGTIEKFKEDYSYTCLLLNVKTLGAGLNLLNARHIFLLDPIINNNDELQAKSRNNRIGQTKTTFVWNFMIRNSVEENIMRYKCMLDGKRKERKIEEHLDSDEEFPSDEEEQFEMNESTGETVSKKHLWNCFFQKNNV
ncbi:hypothetical protein Kpol_1048p73 [Vanderwaltozyma polyspora DSM 70294]|uniref:RING-type domain-containing protein n=1 Tax=Vanderwaltozyma polyspora (strain ATCC 22028 / DSM 70294 / BCRC 21397 / CBS 2163 / NBRC 10782 / NRRL Y-8283 / UCD 57-17) TaxID=436907 RepID=A7TGN5_VANPO|nr:uncharacterized protein Kpol_1048p73 [Vanderwaltozyma polyspora DSM 70294]EDO18642.1 hypothetical protein Kpol_1048p73 [Vanderwaltozyma polyspora DSM 70294]